MVQTRKMIVSKEREVRDNGCNFNNIHKALYMRLLPEFKRRTDWKDLDERTGAEWIHSIHVHRLGLATKVGWHRHGELQPNKVANIRLLHGM
jgi:hypothetical protein